MSDFDNPDVAAAKAPLASEPGHEAPVLVFQAASNEEAEVVRATLEAAGVPAYLHHTSADIVMGATDDLLGEAWVNGVFVAASNVEAARTLLNAPMPTEAELIAAEESDPTTLAEAEAKAKNA